MDVDGNIYITGRTSSGSNPEDVLLLKFDNAGALVQDASPEGRRAAVSTSGLSRPGKRT